MPPRVSIWSSLYFTYYCISCTIIVLLYYYITSRVLTLHYDLVQRGRGASGRITSRETEGQNKQKEERRHKILNKRVTFWNIVSQDEWCAALYL